ncbi:MAG: GAP family protein, partial [Actinomycetaceae bacterium]
CTRTGPTSSPASGASPHPGELAPGLTPDDGGRSAPASGRMLMVLALSAGAIEVATMLPYLAGIGLITANGPGMPGNLLWLAGYCLVMITPALVLVTLRVVAARLVDGPLRKLDSYLTRTAATTTAWVVGIVGVLLALHASAALGWR